MIAFLEGAGYLLTTAENELGVVIARFAISLYFLHLDSSDHRDTQVRGWRGHGASVMDGDAVSNIHFQRGEKGAYLHLF